MTAEEIRLKYYGKNDSRSYDEDEIKLMMDFAKEYHKQQLNIGVVSCSYVVFEDGSYEGVEGMIQLSVPFKTLEEAQVYSNIWLSRKTYVAKMIE